ncbi:hypothetical protein ACI3LZ_004848 [Candidozyma auris]
MALKLKSLSQASHSVSGTQAVTLGGNEIVTGTTSTNVALASDSPLDIGRWALAGGSGYPFESAMVGANSVPSTSGERNVRSASKSSELVTKAEPQSQ